MTIERALEAETELPAFLIHGSLDPYPGYEAWRERHSAAKSAAGWLVTDHAAVFNCLRNRKLGSGSSAFIHGSDEVRRIWANFLTASDEPNHSRFRRPLIAPFNPASVSQLRAFAEKAAADILAGLRHRDRFDLVEEFSLPLPVMILCRTLGVAQSDWHQLGRWSKELTDMLAVQVEPEIKARGLLALEALIAYFKQLVAQKRTALSDDVVSRMLECGDLEDEEIIGLSINLLFGGHETTASLIGNAVSALIANPSQQALLRDHPELMVPAIDEFIRYDAPIPFLYRRALEDTEVEGMRVAAGEAVILMVAAANRDPSKYADPTSLQVDRRPTDHLGFGTGHHFCIGSGLARMVATAGLSALLQATTSIGFAGTPVRTRNPTFRGFESMELSVAWKGAE